MRCGTSARTRRSRSSRHESRRPIRRSRPRCGRSTPATCPRSGSRATAPVGARGCRVARRPRTDNGSSATPQRRGSTSPNPHGPIASSARRSRCTASRTSASNLIRVGGYWTSQRVVEPLERVEVVRPRGSSRRRGDRAPIRPVDLAVVDRGRGIEPRLQRLTPAQHDGPSAAPRVRLSQSASRSAGWSTTIPSAAKALNASGITASALTTQPRRPETPRSPSTVQSSRKARLLVTAWNCATRQVAALERDPLELRAGEVCVDEIARREHAALESSATEVRIVEQAIGRIERRARSTRPSRSHAPSSGRPAYARRWRPQAPRPTDRRAPWSRRATRPRATTLR